MEVICGNELYKRSDGNYSIHFRPGTVIDDSIYNLKKIKNLTYVDVIDVDLEDLNPCVLNDLTSLKELCLSNTNITDISFVKNLTNLELLCLTSNNIVDISSLSNLNNLKELYISHNNIIDVSSLSNLINLEALHLHNNNIKSVYPLRNLSGLRHLNISNNNITDLSSLTELKIKQIRYDEGIPINKTTRAWLKPMHIIWSPPNL